MSNFSTLPGNANREIGVPIDPVWHSRGYLSHYEDFSKIQHVTFHLADSLPGPYLKQLQCELEHMPEKTRDTEHRKRIEALIDQGHGSCILQNPDIARMVEETLLFFDNVRYQLLAWTIMPNHIHALFQPINAWTVAKIVASWKKYTARKICDYKKNADQEIGVPRNYPGRITVESVWYREYWDRFIRNEEPLQTTLKYIHENPVKAGLVKTAQEWPWGSARIHTRSFCRKP